MEEKKKFYTHFLLALQTPFLLLCLYYIYQLFQLDCPNKDVLTWDADLRYITTLNMMDSLRNGQIFSFLFQIVDSPTWPVLRNLVEIPLFFLFGHSQVLDVYLTYATFVVLILSQGYIIWKNTGMELTFPVLFFASWVTLFLSQPFLAYVFTGMMEVQGALFYTLSLFFLYQYLTTSQIPAKKFLLLLFASSFCLFSTKYPYGYIFIFTTVLLLAFLYTESAFLFASRYLIYLFATLRRNPRMIFVFLLLVIFLAVPPKYLPGKTKNYIKYAIALFSIWDFFTYVFKQKSQLLNLGYEKFLGLLQWVALPIFAWVLIHPDRFSSSGSTIAHIQTEGHQVGAEIHKGWDYYTIFFRTYLQETFYYPWIAYILFALLVLAFLEGIYLYKKYRSLSFDFVCAFSCIISILGLTFLTPNHQARHIYHLYPAMFLAASLFLYRGFVSLPIPAILRLVIYILYSSLLSFPVFAEIEKNFAGRLLCFTGTDRKAYELPRLIETEAKQFLKTNTIVINAINPQHVNKADTELLLNRIAYDRKLKLITNPGRKKIPWQDFQSVLVVGNTCLPKLGDVKHFMKIDFPEKKLQLELEKRTNLGCIRNYKIIENTP
ncbi:MAG: hypothetical protein AAF518_00660 [Spirochaetota bacterium]